MTDPQTEEYTLEEAAAIIETAIDRKKSEIECLRKRANRLKKEDKVNANRQLVAYLEADVTAYTTVLADMRDDDTLLEGLDLDAEPVEVPEDYQDYIDGLSADDLENEMDAESIRADYCDSVVEEMCTSIGEQALSSKKMVKALLEDPYALEQIGEVVFYDDYLYDLFKTISAEKAEKKSKKKMKKCSRCPRASTRGS